jgi:hypothetical protein
MCVFRIMVGLDGTGVGLVHQILIAKLAPKLLSSCLF